MTEHLFFHKCCVSIVGYFGVRITPPTEAIILTSNSWKCTSWDPNTSSKPEEGTNGLSNREVGSTFRGGNDHMLIGGLGWWFGFLGSASESDCYLRVPWPFQSRATNPNQQLIISRRSPQKNNYHSFDPKLKCASFGTIFLCQKEMTQNHSIHGSGFEQTKISTGTGWSFCQVSSIIKVTNTQHKESSNFCQYKLW